MFGIFREVRTQREENHKNSLLPLPCPHSGVSGGQGEGGRRAGGMGGGWKCGRERQRLDAQGWPCLCPWFRLALQISPPRSPQRVSSRVWCTPSVHSCGDAPSGDRNGSLLAPSNPHPGPSVSTWRRGQPADAHAAGCDLEKCGFGQREKNSPQFSKCSHPFAHLPLLVPPAQSIPAYLLAVGTQAAPLPGRS